jgi:hypothetical protein
MRWLLAGLLFALAVGLAIGTAAIRADNARWRFAVEQFRSDVHDRVVELTRLKLERLESSSPERLAVEHWAHLEAEAKRRQEALQ